VVRLAWSSIVAVDVEEGYMRICGNVASEDKIVFTLLDRSDGMEFTWRLGQSTQMERRGGWGWGGGGGGGGGGGRLLTAGPPTLSTATCVVEVVLYLYVATPSSRYW